MTEEDVEHQGAEKEALEEIKKVEEDPPDRLEDFPSGKGKYMTMGGPEGQSGYDEGPTGKLGPSEVRFHEGGDVTVGGDKVDNPDDYKGDPIPGGPTDPNAPDVSGIEGADEDGAGDRGEERGEGDGGKDEGEGDGEEGGR